MKLQSKKHPSAAFTLIEIMVVVIILGILAATIIPQFMGTTQDAKISAAKSQVAELESAVERFYIQMDRYPTPDEGLGTSLSVCLSRNASCHQFRPVVGGRGRQGGHRQLVIMKCVPAAQVFKPEEWVARRSVGGSPAGFKFIARFRSRNSPARHPRAHGRLSHPGFTLIELMVVITIIGIMTALMIPEMKGSFQAELLRSNSRELINVFDLAYSRAVSLNQVRRVRLDDKTGRYLVEKQVQENGQEDFVTADDVPGNRGQLDSRIAVEFHPAERLAAEDNGAAEAPVSESSPEEAMIAFYPDGTADPGAVLLRDRDGFRLLLQINPVTARVHVVELEREAQP
jgi:type II secretion system protein H